MMLSRLIRLHWFLRFKVHPSLVIRLNAHGLFIHETSVSPGVLVGKIHRIARELDSAARSALHKVRILIACKKAINISVLAWNEQPYGRLPK